MDIEKYPSPFLTGVLGVDDLMKGAFFQTARGCPFHCAYCTWGRQRPYVEFSIDRVKAELDYFNDHGAEVLFCVDSTFNLNNERAIRILNTARDMSLKSTLWMEVNPQLMDEAFVEALAGVRRSYMGLGIQTTHRETMKIINREWDPDQVSAVLDKVNRHDHCLYGIEIIMGLPGDDLETFKKSVTWAYARRPISIFAFIFQVLPGSPLEREKDRYGIRDGGIEGLHQIESNNTFPAEQIQVGKAMRFWNRIMQQAFYRLVKVTGLPGGDLLEKWTLHARDAGLEEHLPTMQMNRFDRDLLARLAREFGSFCKDVLSAGGLPDVSKRLQEFLRYCFVRRSVAEPTATFFHVMDVYGITIREEDNRIDKMEALGERKLPEDAPRETFTFDMRELWPLTTAEAMSSLAEEPHTYVFMTLEDGGALAVEV